MVSECSLLFQHKVTFDPTSSYTVEDLKPDTLYRFQLAARSELGVGVFTPTIEARTAQSSTCLPEPRLLQLGGCTHMRTLSPRPGGWSVPLGPGLSLDPK